MDDNLPAVPRRRASPTATLDELRDLGVDRVRLSLHWRAIAPDAPQRPARRRPADPRYDASRASTRSTTSLRAARGARHRGALQRHRRRAAVGDRAARRRARSTLQYRPDPRASSRASSRCSARRYDGRGACAAARRRVVDLERAEPGRAAAAAVGGRRGSTSPRIYRALVRAALARAARARATASDIVLLGETAPRGVDRQRPHGRDAARAVPARAALPRRGPAAARARPRGCDFARRGRFDVTGYAHHPYSIVSPPDVAAPATPTTSRSPTATGSCAVLDAAAGARAASRPSCRSGTRSSATRRCRPTRSAASPLDRPGALARRGRAADVPRPARRRARAVPAARRPAARRAAPRRPRYWGTYQSGLRFADGRRKPACDAYRLPLDAPPRVARAASRCGCGASCAPRRTASRAARAARVRAARARRVRAGRRADRASYDPRGYFEVDGAPPQQPGTWRFVWSRRPAIERGRRLRRVGSARRDRRTRRRTSEEARRAPRSSRWSAALLLARRPVPPLVPRRRTATRASTASGPATFTGWEVHTILRWLLLAAAAAPFILAYIIVRGHALSWPRGEMTAVVAIAAFGLVVYNGLIDRPGEPSEPRSR